VKTYEEINEKIRKGEAVVLTAEEMIDVVEEKGAQGAAQEVDVVTTGTFGPMCSSGALLNVGHAKPRIRIHRATLNRVPAYAGLAAVDLYIGATEVQEDDPLNKIFPGEFRYGGGHVIEDLVRGNEVELRGYSYGTDCYPRREVAASVSLKNMNQAVLLNPRNAYQNYNVAANLHSDRPIYTYMGILRPRLGNANYATSGQLSPLLNDPLYRTIGIGTRIFLGGGEGYVFWQGTQHAPEVARGPNGVVKSGAGTIATVGDLKGMDARYLRGASIVGYGVSLSVGLGIPIPILDEEMARFTAVRDEDIVAPVVDYSRDYPELTGRTLGEVSYAELRSGSITVRGKRVPTGSTTSYSMSREIAELLKEKIIKKEFVLTRPVAAIPSAGSGLLLKGLRIRESE